MQMHSRALAPTAEQPKAKRQGGRVQSVYAAVNGHAQATIVAPPETATLQR